MELKSLIEELQAAGLTQAQIAEQAPCGQSTVSGILTGDRGARPGYDLVMKLHALHRKVCGGVCEKAAV